MSGKSLNVLHRPLLLRQCRYRAPDHLEGHLRQFEVLRQLVQDPATVVAGVMKHGIKELGDEAVESNKAAQTQSSGNGTPAPVTNNRRHRQRTRSWRSRW